MSAGRHGYSESLNPMLRLDLRALLRYVALWQHVAVLSPILISIIMVSHHHQACSRECKSRVPVP